MATLHVLIVDDEPGIRSGIQRILRNYTVGYPFIEEDFDFVLHEAETGERAMEIIEEEHIDIVLLDNKLPGIHGVEVLERLNKMKADVQVMMITSYASLDLAVKATQSGAFNFVPKPFTPDELRTAMESITKHLYLKRMTKQMLESGKEVRFQFLSVLSHELKSPINAIEGYLRIMQDRQVGNDLEDYDTMINRSIERINGMRNLIMDLLDLTRLESGKKVRKLEVFDTSITARMAMHTIEPIAIQKNVHMHMEAPENTMFKGDPDELEIIFNNLVSNAVKYNRDGGDVFISSKIENNTFIIRVEDTGIGMSDEEVGTLFQEFQRIKNAKTRNITGSGLGLSIVKKMVEENYHGKIEVTSVPDKGSVFTVELPLNI